MKETTRKTKTCVDGYYYNYFYRGTWSGIAWVDVNRDRDQWKTLVNMVINLRVPQSVGKIISDFTTDGCWRS
jgi:hypothetical protein